MSSTVTTGLKRTFTAGGSVAQYKAVTINSSGQIIEATDTASLTIVGASDRAASSGEAITISLANAGGSAYIMGNDPITAGDKVYAAAGGRVDLVANVTNDVLVGTALSAGGDGEIIEVLFA